MAKQEEELAEQQEESIMSMPGTSTKDVRTYDPTQGVGTPGWQQAVARQKELNEKLGLR